MGAWIETLVELVIVGKLLLSHPVWVRGLKHGIGIQINELPVSHPVWVRGLKRLGLSRNKVAVPEGRTPCGCVD